MKPWLTVLGFVVLLIVLASHGALKGDACLGSAVCAGARGGELTLHEGTP